MKFATTIAVALLAISAHGQPTTPPDSFPSDYVPSACAPNKACDTFGVAEFSSAGRQFLGFSMDVRWIEAHAPEMRAAFEPFCRQIATCFATPNNSAMFCTDVVSAAARPICDTKFPKEKSAHDNEQCREYLEVYFLGVDQQSMKIWRETQACVAKQPPVTHTKPPVTWMKPEVLPVDYPDYVQFFALDPDTHVPLLAQIDIEGQIIYAPSNPAGSSATYYPLKMPFKYMRVPNAEGHTDAVPPTITIKTPGYPPVAFRLNAKVPSMKAEMTPGIPSLHAGANTVTVKAIDVESGKPIDARVMVGDDEAGYTNGPITIKLPSSGKRPEIWLKPFLDRYSDVVIAPAR